MKIYVVTGSTGEYSDRTEWPVRAFRTQAQAEELVERASARARELFQERESKGGWGYDYSGKNAYDPRMQMDYTGTTYYVGEVELVE